MAVLPNDETCHASKTAQAVHTRLPKGHNKADLTGVKLNGTDLSRIRLHRAKLDGANLFGANLSKADLSQATLTKAALSQANLHGANLSKANLDGANLSRADLSQANLSSATYDNAIFIGTKGLYGRNQITADNLQGASTATYSPRWDIPTWERLRIAGSLPLFGVSYLGIISIWVWVTSVELVNYYCKQLRGNDLLEGVKWARNLPDVPMPKHMGLTLLALLLLAAAATLYKLFCPAQIQESSEARWVWELKHPVIVYRSLACSRLLVRWLTALCYIIGGPWVLWLLGQRVFETIRILLFSG